MLSVGEGREGKFLIVFLLQYLLLSGFLVYHEINAVPTDAITTMLAVLIGMASIGFVSAVNTVVLVEGVDMLAERYLKRRYKAGKEEGRAEMNQEWEAWNRRRLEAEKKGRPFTEPTPAQNNHS